MSDETTSSSGAGIVFDDWRTILFAVFMALVGYSVMVTVPVLSTALVQSLSFTEEQVGRVWGNDMLGFSIGAIIAALSVARVNRRHLVMGGIVLTIGANALCMFITDYESMMWLRLRGWNWKRHIYRHRGGDTGWNDKPGSGIQFLVARFLIFRGWRNASVSATVTERYLLVSHWHSCCMRHCFYAGCPADLSMKRKSSYSMNWKIIQRIGACLSSCRSFASPQYALPTSISAVISPISSWPHWTRESRRNSLVTVLTWASFWALAGCLLALLCARFGLFRPLFVALISMAVLVGMLSAGINNINLTISVFSFLALWTFVDVFQSSMMGYMDRSGSLVALLPSVQGFGQFVGPNIAASIIGAGLGYSTMFMVSGSMALVAMAIYIGIFLYMHLHKSAPVEAD